MKTTILRFEESGITETFKVGNAHTHEQFRNMLGKSDGDRLTVEQYGWSSVYERRNGQIVLVSETHIGICSSLAEALA